MYMTMNRYMYMVGLQLHYLHVHACVWCTVIWTCTCKWFAIIIVTCMLMVYSYTCLQLHVHMVYSYMIVHAGL